MDDIVVGGNVEPIETKLVEFYGDQIPVVRLADGRLFVPIRPLAEALGLDQRGQRQRVLRDEVMGEDAVNVVLVSGGQQRTMLAIPLQQLPGYLFGIEAKRVRIELRDKLLLYKREMFDAIWTVLIGGGLSGQPALPRLNDRQLSAQETVRMLTAMLQVAQQQAALEGRVVDVEGKQETMAAYMRGFIVETRHQFSELYQQADNHEWRLGEVERGQATDDPINEKQAAEISLAVKPLAEIIEQRTGRKSFGLVYDTLYKQFDIRSYMHLPRKNFEAAITWLRQWYDDELARQQRK